MVFQFTHTVWGKIVGFLVGVFVVFEILETWTLRWWRLLESKNEEIIRKPGFVQLLMIYEWIFKKWREQMLEGALPEGVWGLFLWKEWGSIWAFCLGCSQLRSSLDKAPEPQLSLQTCKEKLSWIPSKYVWQTSNALQRAHQSKWTFCPWFLFWEEEKSCFSYWWNMACRDKCCIH